MCIECVDAYQYVKRGRGLAWTHLQPLCVHGHEGDHLASALSLWRPRGVTAERQVWRPRGAVGAEGHKQDA